MHGNRGRQQRALNFSTEVNKWFIRAFHVSNIKVNIPKQLFSYPRIGRWDRMCVSKVCKVNFEPNLELDAWKQVPHS